MPTGKYDCNIFFIPTKASLNPVKRDFIKQQSAYMVKHKLAEIRSKLDAKELAMAASERVWDDEMNKMCSYRDLINHANEKIRLKWLTSGENEFGRLFQGFSPNGIKGLDVLEWTQKSAVPRDKKCTYPRYTVDYRPEKDEPDRTRITCGGDVLDYFRDVTTHTASMETIKMHWNSVLSTPDARYCTGDISNMYLMSVLPEVEYVRFRYKLIPPRIIAHYNLDSLVVDGYVYAKINNAWYGLKQSGKISHDDLVQHLTKHGYVCDGTTDRLFTHTTQDISFTLVTNDFGIMFTKEEDVQHLIKIMREKYTFKVDFDATQYIGIHLDWNYEKRELICSMKGYVKQALTKLEHLMETTRHQAAALKMTRPDYGAKVQYVYDDNGEPLAENKIRHIQRVIGKFLYYGRAIDITMQHAINNIRITTAKATTTTEKTVKHFLDYAHCNPDAELIFRASDMILQTDSNAAYLVAPNAQSRAGGYHFLGLKDNKQFNGAIYVLAKIIKNVVTSTMEAEISALYENAQKTVEFRCVLEDMGHPQPPTLIHTDNKTGWGIINGTMKQKRSKAIDIRYNWVKDKVQNHKEFIIEWAQGAENLADYHTKHHSSAHHKRVRPVYLLIACVGSFHVCVLF